MKKLLFFSLIICFISCNQKPEDNTAAKVQLEMKRSQDSLNQELYNINFATKLTHQKIKQGMSVDEALKFQKHLIDSLNKK